MKDRDLPRLSWYTTALFALTAFGACAFEFMRGPAVVVAGAMFALGTVAMAATLVIAAGRSRRDVVDVGGLFFLSNSAPAEIRRHLMGAFAAQCAIGLGSAAIRPFTTLAFGVLAPIAGLGLAGLWGARHGTFPERTT